MNASENPGSSRREFLENTGRVVAASALAGVALPAVHAGESNTIQVALVGCGGRGTGAAANALSTKSGPIKLVAMADVFEHRLKMSYEALTSTGGDATSGSVDRPVSGWDPAQVDVPPDRQFIGFDAYKKAMDCLKPGDVVILATPRLPLGPLRLRHREGPQRLHGEAGRPSTGPSTRKMLALAEQSVKKNLKVGVGLMCRHCEARKELFDADPGRPDRRHHLPAGLPPGRARRASPAPSRPSISELLYQIQQVPRLPLGQRRLLQRLPHPQHRRMLLDEGRLAGPGPGLRRPPLPRRRRRSELRQLLGRVHLRRRHEAVPGGRNMAGCHDEFASYAHGTKGSAVISTNMHTPAKCRIYKGQNFVKDDLAWAFPQPEPNPYQLEWDHLIDAIRKDKPYNEVKRGAEASLVQLDGPHGRPHRPGRHLRRDAQLRPRVRPGRRQLTMDSPAPLRAGKDGKYPLPQPGIITQREF